MASENRKRPGITRWQQREDTWRAWAANDARGCNSGRPRTSVLGYREAVSFNALNQYTAVGGTNRSHDKNGNLTDDGTYDFEYDYRN